MQPFSPLRAATALALLAVAATGCYPVQPAGSTPAPARSASKGAPAATEIAQQGSVSDRSASKGRTKNEKRANDKRARAMRAAAGHLSEGHVVALVLAYNNADISYARIAAARSKNASVRGFARRLITDAAGINERALNLVRVRGDIDLEENEATLEMRELSAARRDQLRSLSGAEFDAAFINGEISYHRALLTRIDELLLPATKDEELQKLLTMMRPAVAAHLAQAQQVGAGMDPGERLSGRR